MIFLQILFNIYLYKIIYSLISFVKHYKQIYLSYTFIPLTSVSIGHIMQTPLYKK